MVGVTQPRTLAEKVWDAHVVRSADGEPDLLFIEPVEQRRDLFRRHAQAFPRLREEGIVTPNEVVARESARQARRFPGGSKQRKVKSRGCLRVQAPQTCQRPR